MKGWPKAPWHQGLQACSAPMLAGKGLLPGTENSAAIFGWPKEVWEGPDGWLYAPPWYPLNRTRKYDLGGSKFLRLEFKHSPPRGLNE